MFIAFVYMFQATMCPPPPPPLLPSYWACRASIKADIPTQFRSGGFISYRTTETVLPVLRKTSGNECKMWWKLEVVQGKPEISQSV
jgi:hypothetical protein